MPSELIPHPSSLQMYLYIADGRKIHESANLELDEEGEGGRESFLAPHCFLSGRGNNMHAQCILST